MAADRSMPDTEEPYTLYIWNELKWYEYMSAIVICTKNPLACRFNPTFWKYKNVAYVNT